MPTHASREPAARIAPLHLAHATMQDAVDALREQGVPLCFEQVPLAPEQATRLPDGSIEYARARFDVDTPAGSLPAVLDALTQADAAYRWETAGAPPCYVVYPAAAGALAWPVQPRRWAGQDWVAAIQSLDLAAHDIALFPRGLERQPRVALDRFDPGPQNARRWLTALIAFVDQGRYWNLAGVGAERTLVLGQVAPAPSPPGA
jgi:hypothetical protein